MYVCQSQSPNSSHPYFPPWYPYICSLCLYFCFVNKIIYNNVFQIPHIFINIWYLFFWLTSLCMTVSRSIKSQQMTQCLQFTNVFILPLPPALPSYLLPSVCVCKCVLHWFITLIFFFLFVFFLFFFFTIWIHFIPVIYKVLTNSLRYNWHTISSNV